MTDESIQGILTTLNSDSFQYKIEITKLSEEVFFAETWLDKKPTPLNEV
ncbi:hypothetical protein [Aureispira sp. CCB-QB1]|nr:hypothetical protein [Aureispira sp. CCB-QB1]